jgi:hypothetical protein
MKKTIVLIVAIFFITICLIGCTKKTYTAIIYSEDSEDNFWSASYERFNGYRQRDITISGENSHIFSVEINTSSGTLDLSIKDSEGTSLYTGNEIPSSSFEVEANSEGKYSVRFDADNHTGSFNIQWE